MSRLAGKTALVTGAAAGIGLAIARHFVRQGATVWLTDVEKEGGGRAAEDLGARFHAQDVTDSRQWRAVLDALVERGGRLDILVNNAGIDIPERPQDPEHVSLDDWHSIQRVNLDGVMLGCKHAIPLMKGGGAIVNVSSIAALVATPMFSAYGASKAAVMQYTKSVAAYCAKAGYRIRCNSIHPGVVETALVQKFWRKLESAGEMSYEEARAMFLQMIPLGEFATADDIAEAAVYLAADESRHVTGAHLVVDGGITLNAPG